MFPEAKRESAEFQQSNQVKNQGTEREWKTHKSSLAYGKNKSEFWTFDFY